MKCLIISTYYFNIMILTRSTLATVILSMLLCSSAQAGSCPYCGQQYGDAMPGDEARVYALRREHEANCPARQGSGGGGPGGFGTGEQGLVNAFAWGIQQGIANNQRMQEQAAVESTRLNNLGVEAENTGDYDLAIRYYQEALQTCNNPVARKNLDFRLAVKGFDRGVAYAQNGEWENAVNEFNAAERLAHVNGYENWVDRAKDEYADEQERKRQERHVTREAERVLQDVIAKAKTADSPVYAPGSTSDLEFLKVEEPIVSKGDKNSAPPEISGANIRGLKTENTKGLKISEPPAHPAPIPPPDDPYSVKTAGQIMLDALSEHGRDWSKSINSLKSYLILHPNHVKVQQALSSLEGMREREEIAFPPKKPGIFDPSEKDSEALLEVLVPESRAPAKEAAPRGDLEEWRYRRNARIIEVMTENKGNWKKGLTQLENDVAGNPNDFTGQNALHYMQGYCSYTDYLEKEKTTAKR